MARFLFTSWEGGGHVQPLLLCAQGLIQRGHEVLAISDACNGLDAEALSVPFQAWRTAPNRPDKSPASDLLKDWEDQTPFDAIQRICERLIAGPADRYAADVLETLSTFKADVVVTQELLFGVIAAAEKAGLPCALFVANIWPFATLPGQPPFGAGMAPAEDDNQRALHGMIADTSRKIHQLGLPAMNAVREGLGLAPLADLFDQIDTAAAILLATSPAFDFAPDPLPAPFAYVGPYLSDPNWAQPWTSPWPADDARPLVLVSFSSLYQAQEGALRRVIEALGGRDVRAVITLGPTLSVEDFPAPDNIAVLASAPHGDLLPLASLMITHAGHGSALRPLMAGVPLVCLPMGRDQNDNAVRIEQRGAGLKLAANASAEAIGAAADRVLADPAFAEAARALGQAVARDAAGRAAEPVLEMLVRVPA